MMKQFKLYANPQESYEAVKQGWSWPAFFFVWIWALVKKMWVLGFCVFGVFIAIRVIGTTICADLKQEINTITFIGSLVLSIVFGINGNKWRETNLTHRGFDFKEAVTAANVEGAIALSVKNGSTNQNS